LANAAGQRPERRLRQAGCTWWMWSIEVTAEIG
jgi:hypothetical protein